MKRLRNWALASTAATYVLIFVGGLVRVSGAGLGCPDWPKCFGRWFPPTDISQLPSWVDPLQFNPTLAWIEYINRLVGVTIGILITVTAVLAVLRARRFPRILYPVLAAFVLVLIEGWQGSVVISSKLAPFVVTIHMALAFLIVSLLLYATLQLYRVTGRGGTGAAGPVRFRGWLVLLWILTIVEVALGTQVRSALTVLAEQYELLPGMDLLEPIGWIGYIHRSLGGIVTLVTLYVGIRVLRQRAPRPPLTVISARLLIVTALAQVLLGVILVTVNLAPLLQLFHLWLSSFYVGVLLTLHYALGHEEADHVGQAA